MMANTKDKQQANVNPADQGSPRQGFTSSSDVGTSKADASSQDSQPESAFAETRRVQTTNEIINQDRPTAEEMRQQQQRDDTQAFLDLQEQQRQAMTAQTKATEEQQKKAAQREQNVRKQQQQQQNNK